MSTSSERDTVDVKAEMDRLRDEQAAAEEQALRAGANAAWGRRH